MAPIPGISCMGVIGAANANIILRAGGTFSSTNTSNSTTGSISIGAPPPGGFDRHCFISWASARYTQSTRNITLTQINGLSVTPIRTNRYLGNHLILMRSVVNTGAFVNFRVDLDGSTNTKSAQAFYCYVPNAASYNTRVTNEEDAIGGSCDLSGVQNGDFVIAQGCASEEPASISWNALSEQYSVFAHSHALDGEPTAGTYDAGATISAFSSVSAMQAVAFYFA